MRGEVGKKIPKKEIDNLSFLWLHMADFWDTLSSYEIQGSKGIGQWPINWYTSPMIYKITLSVDYN